MVAYRTPGGPPPSSAAAPPPPVSVCRRCGVVAPAEGSACAVCKRPLGETRAEVPAPSPDTFWVAVRCGFTCNQCRFLAPLDALDADGAVDCAHCGLHQRFDVGSWAPALDFAHAVGDLAGPLPEGRNPHPVWWIGSENPHADVGVSRTFDRVESGVLAVEAAPGHPVCRKCHVPLGVSVGEPGVAHTRCPQCGAAAAYALPDAVRRLSGAIVAVVADDHRTDAKRAQATATQAGVVALSCPSCGGPLGVPDGGGIAACSFCGVACIVPLRVRNRARNEKPEPDVWWILFQGASTERRRLEAPTDGDAGGGVQAALKLFKPGAGAAAIGDAPGVYDAPEVTGIHWPQVALTAALGTAAAAIGMLIYEILLR
jgi:hypothetical protein